MFGFRLTPPIRADCVRYTEWTSSEFNYLIFLSSILLNLLLRFLLNLLLKRSIVAFVLRLNPQSLVLFRTYKGTSAKYVNNIRISFWLTDVVTQQSVTNFIKSIYFFF